LLPDRQDFSSEAMSTSCGTPTYVAPEVLLGSPYDVQCDVWSTGVITYILLSSHIPFDGDGESEVFERILSACYSFPSPLWDPVSAKGMLLLLLLLLLLFLFLLLLLLLVVVVLLVFL
jgi:serine/threonine protein kinase